jgi:Family of unknown function (DUF6163)
MTDPRLTGQQELEPVQTGAGGASQLWSARLVQFLRAMAGLSLLKGLYHWAVVCGFFTPADGVFADAKTPYQAATVFFAVIDLVAAVGLWLAAPWGAVVWLTSVISMVAVEFMFPQIYGGRIWVVVFECVLLGTYLWLALFAAREQPT